MAVCVACSVIFVKAEADHLKLPAYPHQMGVEPGDALFFFFLIAVSFTDTQFARETSRGENDGCVFPHLMLYVTCCACRESGQRHSVSPEDKLGCFMSLGFYKEVF